METLNQQIEKWENHGKQVNIHYNLLLKNPEKIKNEKIENWIKNSYSAEDLSKYHLNHDMGKPYCFYIDDEGKYHYPNHSKMSFAKYCTEFGHDKYADMILHDMDFHTKRNDDLRNTWKLPNSDHLYVTSWAELFANAEIFGGTESESFKIKRKRLIKAFDYKS